MMRFFLIGLLCLLTGCAAQPQVRTVTKVVEVSVPVAVHRTPPDELAAAPVLPLPMFVPVVDPEATSALTPQGETRLRIMILELIARERAWRAWAREPAPRTDKPP